MQKPQRIFEVVCEGIRRDVDEGRLRPGDKLPAERELAERLGVSRAAVREGLRALEASGVLEFRKGVYGGAFIRDVSASGIQASISDMLSIGNISLEQLAETRTALLALAARLACARATEDDLAAIERNVERTGELASGGDRAALVNAITEFYALMGAASHNAVLRILIEAVSEVSRDLLMKITPASHNNIAVQRRPIVQALRARDAEAAVTLMTEQIIGYHNFFVTHGGDYLLQAKAQVRTGERPAEKAQ
ncbi:MAG: FadR/GntR family transcriptional regulator [Hyphomonadaceae bacterium]